MSTEEEAAASGSRIKMKIKFTNLSPISSANATSSSPAEDQIVKKEPDHDPNFKTDDPIPHPTHHTPPSPHNHSPSSTGKRKKKPKQMHDDFLCHAGKRRRKPFSKSPYTGSSRGHKWSRQRKLLTNGVPNPEVITRAMVRAEEFQSTLGSEFPIFTKPMVRSHVVNGFWMGIPGYFSREHLPRTDTTVILVDEEGKEFELKYIGEKMGLSAGWKNFCVEQKLLEDDVLIFQLVEPCKFKVYVVRANDLSEVDGALSLLNLEANIVPNDAGGEDSKTAPYTSTYKRKRMKSLQCSALVLKNKKTRPRRSVSKTLQLIKKFENGFRKTDHGSSFFPDSKNIKSFDDFRITVDGLCIDSELPEDIRANYFNLCSTRNDILHARLIQGLNSKLIAGIICETVDISNALRTCTMMTGRDEFVSWEKTLKSFELLGMSVGFLRDRVHKLLRIAYESDGAFEARKYVEAKMGKVRAEEEIINLETKIVELKDASEKYSADIEALKFKAESYEIKFQEAVDAPW